MWVSVDVNAEKSERKQTDLCIIYCVEVKLAAIVANFILLDKILDRLWDSKQKWLAGCLEFNESLDGISV